MTGVQTCALPICIYPHVHFLPLDDFGARLLGILTLPDWQERLLDLLFEPSTRTYGRGTLEYDAQVDGVKVLSHLDGDLARLLRFREGLWSHEGKFEVVCLPQQAEFVRSFLGDRAEVRKIPLDVYKRQPLWCSKPSIPTGWRSPPIRILTTKHRPWRSPSRKSPPWAPQLR